jgi:hypothetical protein
MPSKVQPITSPVRTLDIHTNLRFKVGDKVKMLDLSEPELFGEVVGHASRDRVWVQWPGNVSQEDVDDLIGYDEWAYTPVPKGMKSGNKKASVNVKASQILPEVEQRILDYDIGENHGTWGEIPPGTQKIWVDYDQDFGKQVSLTPRQQSENSDVVDVNGKGFWVIQEASDIDLYPSKDAFIRSRLQSPDYTEEKALQDQADSAGGGSVTAGEDDGYVEWLESLGPDDDTPEADAKNQPAWGELEACPGCGSMPGDDLTEGCDHPDGCGEQRLYGSDVENSDPIPGNDVTQASTLVASRRQKGIQALRVQAALIRASDLPEEADLIQAAAEVAASIHELEASPETREAASDEVAVTAMQEAIKSTIEATDSLAAKGHSDVASSVTVNLEAALTYPRTAARNTYIVKRADGSWYGSKGRRIPADKPHLANKFSDPRHYMSEGDTIYLWNRTQKQVGPQVDSESFDSPDQLPEDPGTFDNEDEFQL